MTLGDDSKVFSPGTGGVTECGQAAGWGDWGKAGVDRAASLMVRTELAST